MYTYQFLTEKELPQMKALAERVMASLPNKRWYFYCDGDPQQWLEEGKVIGCLEQEKLVGLAAYSLAENRMAHSYAAIVGDKPFGSIDFHDIMIDEEHRRRGIHTEFCHRIRQEALSLGKHGIYLTIDPENLPSRAAFEKNGYLCRLTQPAYDGRIRCYYCLKLNLGGTHV